MVLINRLFRQEVCFAADFGKHLLRIRTLRSPKFLSNKRPQGNNPRIQISGRYRKEKESRHWIMSLLVSIFIVFEVQAASVIRLVIDRTEGVALLGTCVFLKIRFRSGKKLVCLVSTGIGFEVLSMRVLKGTLKGMVALLF